MPFVGPTFGSIKATGTFIAKSIDGLLTGTSARFTTAAKYAVKDKNNDGVLDKAEWGKNQDSFKRYDKNGDSKVSKQEHQDGVKQDLQGLQELVEKARIAKDLAEPRYHPAHFTDRMH